MKIHKHTHAVSLQINQLDFKQNVVFVVVQDFISEYCLSYDDYTGLANLITQSRKFCTIEIKRMKTKNDEKSMYRLMVLFFFLSKNSSSAQIRIAYVYLKLDLNDDNIMNDIRY